MNPGLYKASTSESPFRDNRTYMFYYDGTNWYQYLQDRYGRGWTRLVGRGYPPVFNAVLSKMSRLEFTIRTGKVFRAM